MFVGCNYYLFYGYLLTDDKFEELKIKQAYKFQVASILDNYKRVLKVNKDGVVIAEIPAIKEELMNGSNTDTIFYVKKADYIVFPNIDTYYGIYSGDKVVAIYNDPVLRDAKLSCANMMGFGAIFEDVTQNQDIVVSINQQLELNKSYQKLKNNCKRGLD